MYTFVHHIILNQHFVPLNLVFILAFRGLRFSSFTLNISQKGTHLPVKITGWLWQPRATYELKSVLCVGVPRVDRSKVLFRESTSSVPKTPESGKSWSRQGDDGSVLGDSVFAWLTLMTAWCPALTECFHSRRASKPLSPFKSSSFTAKPETMPTTTFGNNLCPSCRPY